MMAEDGVAAPAGAPPEMEMAPPFSEKNGERRRRR